MNGYPEARDFGYKGNMGWKGTADWHRWKIAQNEWLIEHLKDEIKKHGQKIRELEG